MRAEDVIGVHDALTDAGLDYWIGGGWGVDALIGSETRKHDDLDISVRSESLQAVLELLDRSGFRPHVDWLPTRIALRDDSGREIDVHPLRFQADGSAWLPGIEGNRFEYPTGSFTTGLIGGRRVPCISAALQASFHTGYPLQPKDLADIAALRAAGLLPEELT